MTKNIFFDFKAFKWRTQMLHLDQCCPQDCRSLHTSSCPQCRLFLVCGCVAVATAVAGILIGVMRTLSREELWWLS